MESAHKSEGGSGSATGAGAGAEGVLCHACGYQYPNGHPSAKQRRAHRKNCGKPASAAVVEDGAGEHDGSEMLLGEGSGGAGGDGNGAGATECGGGAPGSAPEAADAVAGGDSAGADPSGNGAGHQVIGDKSAEDGLISSSNIPSEITPGDPSDPAVGSEPLQDVPTSVVSPEPEDGAKFSSEISEYEILNSSSEYQTQNPSVVPLESDATGGGTSELTSDVVRQQDEVVAVTGEDGMINTVDETKCSEGKSVQADELSLSCQDILQTEIGEGHSSTIVDEDSGDKNPTASNNEEILSELTDSFEKVPDIEPVESSAEKPVGTDDDLIKPDKGGCHSEIPDDIKAQQQPDSTSERADHLAISKRTDNVEGQHYPTTDESIGAIPSTSGAAVDAKVISVNATTNLTEDACSSGITIDDSMQEHVASDAVVPTQVDLADSSPSAAAHEINMFGSINDVDEKRQNEKSSTDLASYEVKEMVIMDNFEEKQQNKEVTVDPTPHEADYFPSTDNHGENKHNEETIADTTTYKISALQSMSNIEEKEQIEVFIANLASEEINVTSNRDMPEQQDETDVKTNHEIDRPHNIEAAGENNATADESSAGTIIDDVEDKMPNEEITPGTISFNIADSSINEEKMHNEVNEGLGSHDNIVAHGPDNVKEKMYGETMSDPTLDKFSLLTSTDSPEEKRDENTSADPDSHETTVTQTSESIDEEKNREPAVDPTSSVGTMGGIVDVQDKKRNEETTADPRSVDNATTEGTKDIESSKQSENATTTDEAAVAQNTNVIEVNEAVEDTASREISAIESADDLKGATDHNEEIADKEMVTDSDKNHVSLKVLLADKNVETKEKEKKASTKDRVLSFGRRVSKDNVSPVKPGSPTASSGQQDWNSPARLPVEKKPKGRKQQWVPFICCSSVQ